MWKHSGSGLREEEGLNNNNNNNNRNNNNKRRKGGKKERKNERRVETGRERRREREEARVKVGEGQWRALPVVRHELEQNGFSSGGFCRYGSRGTGQADFGAILPGRAG